MATDRLLIRHECDVATEQLVYQWPEPERWPPPEIMVLLISASTDVLPRLSELDDLSGAVSQYLRDHPVGDLTVRVRKYRLHHASEIPEPAPDGAHWFRGAEYLPEEVFDDQQEEQPSAPSSTQEPRTRGRPTRQEPGPGEQVASHDAGAGAGAAGRGSGPQAQAAAQVPQDPAAPSDLSVAPAADPARDQGAI